MSGSDVSDLMELVRKRDATIVALQVLLNECYESSRAPTSDELDKLKVPTTPGVIVNRYTVYFLYNARGAAAVDHILNCDLPEGRGPRDILHGFWIDDANWRAWKVKYVTDGSGNMWVPPSRVTSVVRAE